MDTIHRLLGHGHRRNLLDALAGRDDPLELADAATEVVRQTRDEPAGPITDEETRRCHLSLYHRHVPILVENGVVETDEGYETVRLTEEGARLAAVRRRCCSTEQ